MKLATDPLANEISSHAAQSTRLSFLDGLRALCAIWVLVGHCHLFAYGWKSHQSLWTQIANVFLYLHLGVVVFLVLSGFCLMLPVIRNGNRLQTSTADFFKARALRILPPYYACLVLILLVNFFIPVVGWGRHPHGLTETISWQSLSVNFFLLQDFFPQHGNINGPFWSIAVEWHLYFLFPILAWTMWRFGATVMFIGGCILAAAINWISMHPPAWIANLGISILIPSYFFYLFVFGCFAAYLSFGVDSKYYKIRDGILTVLAAISITWFVYLIQRYSIFDAKSAGIFFDHTKTIDMVFAMIAAISLVFLARASDSKIQARLLRFLEVRPLVSVGHFSYSLYLVHIPILAIVHHQVELLQLPTNFEHLHFILVAVVGGGFSIAFAWGFSKLFETKAWLTILRSFAFKEDKGT